MAGRPASISSGPSSYAPPSGPSATSSNRLRSASPVSSLLSPNTGVTAPSARSRHSLYGAEDRVVLDLGSRVWKIGFSGESAPRAVFDVGELWTHDGADLASNKEQQRHCQRMIKKLLRRVFYDELMTDSKARKVIILENPLLPLRIKQIAARVLFEHLQIPSLSFALSPLCALLSIGRATGLVLDVGNLETTLLPIFASRPLFPHLRTSCLASRRLTFHLRDLLRRFAVYHPHVAQSATASRSSTQTQAADVTPIPDEVLTLTIAEEIKTRACYVDPDMLDDNVTAIPSSHAPHGNLNSGEYAVTASDKASHLAYQALSQENLWRKYNTHSSSDSEATNLTLRLPTGTLTIPGWLRHACTDIFFDSTGDVDEPSIPELILGALLKLPMDLRKVFISNILLIGGGSMLPGFPLRLSEAIKTLLHRDKRYVTLRGLSRNICIVNCSNPSPSPATGQSEEVSSEDGQAASFAWERSLLAWVGASLVGAMKGSGKEEWTRAAWDAATQAGQDAIEASDWTRRGW